jgi:hypothetical protein
MTIPGDNNFVMDDDARVPTLQVYEDKTIME